MLSIRMSEQYRIAKCKYYDTNEVHNTDI
jgi:hypothetical protein